MTATLVGLVPAIGVEVSPGADASYTAPVDGYLSLGGGYAYTTLSFAGNDLDFSVLAAATDWTTAADQVLFSHYNATGGRSWYLAIEAATGKLKFVMTTDGSTNLTAKSNTLSETDGVLKWHRVTRDKATGTVTLYTADHVVGEDPADTDWFPVGSAVLAVGSAPWPTTAKPELGVVAIVPPTAGGSTPFAGKILAARYKVDGVTVASPDYRAAAGGADHVVDGQGNTWANVSTVSIVAGVAGENVGQANLDSALLTVQAAPVVAAPAAPSGGGATGIGLDWIPTGGLDAFHAALEAGVCDLLHIGDSITEYAAASTIDGGWTRVFLAQVRARFQPAGVTGGFGYLQPWFGAAVAPGVDPWTRSGGVNMTDTGLAMKGYKLDTVGDSMQHTAMAFTRADIIFRRQPTAGQIHVDVDGVITTVDCSGTETKSVRATVTAAAGTHTFTITNVSGINVIEAVEFFNGDEASGIRAVNAGHGGWQAANWAADTSVWTPGLAAVTAPGLATVMLGLNDRTQTPGRTPDQVVTSLTTIVAVLRSNLSPTPSIVVVNEWNGGAAQPGMPSWDDYETAIYNMVRADGSLCFYDARERQGDAVVHPDTVGHSAIGLGLATLVLP